MADTSIRISADLSQLEAAVAKVESKVEGVNKALTGGKVKIDTAAAERELQELQEQFDEIKGAASKISVDEASVERLAAVLERASAAAEKLQKAAGKGGASGGAAGGMRDAAHQASTLASGLERARRVQDMLRREGAAASGADVARYAARYDAWRSSGAAGTRSLRNVSFDEFMTGGWSRRRYQEVLEAVGARAPEKAAGAGTPKGALWRAVASAGRGVAGDAASVVGGGVGSGAMGAIGEAMGAGSMFAPVLAIAGGAMLASKVIGAIGRHVHEAGQEAISYTDLRHSMGELATDFDDLRGTVRGSVRDLGVSFSDAARYAHAYATAANVAFGGVGSLSSGMRAGVGMSRAFGLSPEAGIQFFAAMQRYQVSHGEAGDRRLAASIAEAIGQSGSAANVQQLMSAVQQLVSTTARMSLSSPDAAAMAAQVGGLMSLKMPGLAAGGADALAMQVASAWAGGGGDAGQNFRLAWLQRATGGSANAFDLQLVNSAGPFGSGLSAFGPRSMAYLAAAAAGDRRSMRHFHGLARMLGGRTFNDYEFAAIHKQFGSSVMSEAAALSGMYHIGMPQALAYETLFRTSGASSPSDLLRKYGVDPSKVSTTKMGALAGILGGDTNVLEKSADSLLSMGGAEALSSKDRAALQSSLSAARSGADSGGEGLRRLLVQLAARYNMPQDQGSIQRAMSTNLANLETTMATKVVPLQQAMTAGILKIAGFSASVIRSAVGSAGSNPWVDKQFPGPAAPVVAAALGGHSGPFPVASHGALAAGMAQHVGAPGTLGSDDLLAALNIGARSGMFHDSLSAQYARSTLRLPGLNGKYQIGGASHALPRSLRNNNPGNIEYGTFARAHGAVGTDGRFAIFPSMAAGRAAMDSLVRLKVAHGKSTLTSLISSWAPPSDHNNDAAYVASVSRATGIGPNAPLRPDQLPGVERAMSGVEGGYSDRLPAGMPSSAGGGAGRLAVDVTVHGVLHDSSGKHIGRLHPVQTTVSAPVPAGVAN